MEFTQINLDRIGNHLYSRFGWLSEQEREQEALRQELLEAQMVGFVAYTRQVADVLMPDDHDWLHLNEPGRRTSGSLHANPELFDTERYIER